jgi:urease accessory protein
LSGASVIAAASVKKRDDIFAANRALGRIALTVAADKGLTRRKRVQESGSLRVRFPNSDLREPEAVIVNTAGGIAGGDRFDLDFALGEGARLVVTTAAAEKVYRALGPDAAIAVKLSLGAGAALTWLPQETILFDRVRLSRSIDVDLAEDASLLLAESIVFGRSAMGETVAQGRLLDRWRVRRGGRLVFAETVRLEDGIARKLSEPAGLNGGAAIATLLMVPGDDSKVAALRALSENFAGEVGISAWNGIAVVRLCARDGAALRRDLVLLLAALRTTLPRLWLN